MKIADFYFAGGGFIATTRLMSLHSGSGRSVAAALRDSTAYVENPEKTNDGELVTAYECDPRTVDTEFALSKRQYAELTGRSQGKNDVIAYHLRQSFKPKEITPELANEIGRELALRFTKGNHAFIVATHIDTKCCHNHIIFNSTTLDSTKKFRDFLGSGKALGRLSDQICIENGLSVIENPKRKGKHYGAWLADNLPAGQIKPLSYQEKLRRAIDYAFEQKPADFNDFLRLMKSAGYEVKLGKHLAFRGAGQKKFTRCDTLKDNYTDDSIMKRLSGELAAPAREQAVPQPAPTQKISLLIDIQQKIQEGKGQGYQQWAKIRNLKSLAKTLIYLQENKLDDYDVLKEKAAKASARFRDISDKIKAVDEKLTANANLQRHIVTYSKTRNTYAEYRKAGYSKKFKELHEADILLHQTAKRAFDELGLTKLPTVASLRTDYTALLDEKKRLYRDYHSVKSGMKELLTAKSNVDSFFKSTNQTLERNPNEPSL